MFRGAKISGSKMVITFDGVGQGLKMHDGNKLDEFAVGGADRKWHWASAQCHFRSAPPTANSSSLLPSCIFKPWPTPSNVITIFEPEIFAPRNIGQEVVSLRPHTPGMGRAS